MREFKTTSLADQVFERLENDIIQGVYQKGEILTELKLVDQLGVSRTPIREALRRLEQERLIADSGKGTVVLGITEDDIPWMAENCMKVSAASIANNPVVFNQHEIEEIYRKALVN